MRYLSVCAGIEAASVAWHHMGWTPAAFSEIEPFPSAVLANHYPNVPNWGDMTKFQEWPHANVDVLVGGTPCQSFSVAGLRAGLADPRGNLMLTFGAIAKRYRPKWLVWENVPGVLSSNGGRDFGAFLGMLGQLGYGFSFRVLDAQYFGVAQRRRRVFVVGCLGDWRRAAAVLFEQHSLSGHPAPSRPSRKGAARGATPSVAGSLDTECGGGKLTHQSAANGHIIAQPLTFKVRGGVEVDSAGNSAGKGFLGSEDTAFTLAATQDQWLAQPVASTLNAAFGSKQGLEDQHALAGAPLFVPAKPITFGAKMSVPQTDVDMVQTLQATNPMAVAQPVGVTLHGTDGTQAVASFTELSSSLRARIPSGVENSTTTAVMQPIALQDVRAVEKAQNGRGWNDDGSAYTVDTHATQGVAAAMQVRRLTPTECERLQGFPDGYTAIPWRNKSADQCPDGPRYKALGNSMAVPVMRWIGERIARYDQV